MFFIGWVPVLGIMCRYFGGPPPIHSQGSPPNGTRWRPLGAKVALEPHRNDLNVLFSAPQALVNVLPHQFNYDNVPSGKPT